MSELFEYIRVCFHSGVALVQEIVLIIEAKRKLVPCQFMVSQKNCTSLVSLKSALYIGYPQGSGGCFLDCSYRQSVGRLIYKVGKWISFRFCRSFEEGCYVPSV